MNNKTVLDIISQCIVCGKPVALHPWETGSPEQWLIRCKKHQKELLKIWPARIAEYWKHAKES